MSRLARDAVLVALIGGVLVGVLWWLWLPENLMYQVAGGEPFLDAVNRSLAFAVEARLALLVLVTGLLAGAILWRRNHDRPAVTIVAVVVVGIVGSALAAEVGGRLGPAPLAERAAPVADGGTIGTDLVLSSGAVLLLWPMMSLVVILLWVAVDGIIEQVERVLPRSA